MYIVGIDAGNNSTITSSNNFNSKKAVILPTECTDHEELINENAFGQRELSSFEDLDVSITLNTNTTKPTSLGRKFVGYRAYQINESKFNNISRSIGQEKVGDKDLKICMLTSLAYSVMKHQNKFEGHIKEDVSGVLSLPYEQYLDNLDKEDPFGKEFKGKHEVRINHQGNEAIVDLNIINTTTDCEGAGALNNHIYNNDFSAEEWLERSILGIDVGEFTTETKIKPVKHFSTKELIQLQKWEPKKSPNIKKFKN